jgi:hypothetical protein
MGQKKPNAVSVTIFTAFPDKYIEDGRTILDLKGHLPARRGSPEFRSEGEIGGQPGRE